MPAPKLHLASSSPRRAELLRALKLQFTAAGTEIAETRLPGESPREMVRRLAAAKAAAAPIDDDDESAVVLGADTAVVLDDVVFGKPVDQADGVRMLLALSSRSHQVLTAVALRSARGIDTALSTSNVRFREIRRDEAIAYWQSGEPHDKAGAYAIQGIGGVFVQALEGSYTGVVGLPVFETTRLLASAGIEVLDIQR